jgi:hypothetical protein
LKPETWLRAPLAGSSGEAVCRFLALQVRSARARVAPILRFKGKPESPVRSIEMLARRCVSGDGAWESEPCLLSAAMDGKWPPIARGRPEATMRAERRGPSAPGRAAATQRQASRRRKPCSFTTGQLAKPCRGHRLETVAHGMPHSRDEGNQREWGFSACKLVSLRKPAPLPSPARWLY